MNDERDHLGSARLVISAIDQLRAIGLVDHVWRRVQGDRRPEEIALAAWKLFASYEDIEFGGRTDSKYNEDLQDLGDIAVENGKWLIKFGRAVGHASDRWAEMLEWLEPWEDPFEEQGGRRHVMAVLAGALSGITGFLAGWVTAVLVARRRSDGHHRDNYPWR